MRLDFDSGTPLYLQIAAQLEDAIVTGAFAEETQIPSTTEISSSFQINPATVLKGMNQLVEEAILYKKRGVGMFVSTGAQLAIKEKRRKSFYDQYICKLVSEARKLGLSKQDIFDFIQRSYDE